MKTVGLFAGSGSLETGLERSGHACDLLCEISEPARRVLRARFPDVPIERDVAQMRVLPAVDMVSAGFPCQDVSLSGPKEGFDGARSGLVREIFRLIDASPVPTVLLENVANIVRLHGGRWVEILARAFEDRGYRWAYRIVDARAALPQRRERFFMLASRVLDPAEVLFADDVPEPLTPFVLGRHAAGFYWTRGASGLGWAPHCTPPIQGGSAKGIPSGPAVLLPDGRVVRIGIADAERLQGMTAGSTEPAGTDGARWKIVGNAVALPIAEWIGARLASHGPLSELRETSLADDARIWPRAARGGPTGGRRRVEIGSLPYWAERPPISASIGDAQLLSPRATRGFLARAERGRMNFEPGFLDAVRAHLQAVGGSAGPECDLFAIAA